MEREKPWSTCDLWLQTKEVWLSLEEGKFELIVQVVDIILPPGSSLEKVRWWWERIGKEADLVRQRGGLHLTLGQPDKTIPWKVCIVEASNSVCFCWLRICGFQICQEILSSYRRREQKFSGASWHFFDTLPLRDFLMRGSWRLWQVRERAQGLALTLATLARCFGQYCIGKALYPYLSLHKTSKWNLKN